jgi:signal peptidase I
MVALTSEAGAVMIESTRSKRRRVRLHFVGQALSWFVMLGVGVVLLAAVFVPRLAGATPYVIETGSMRPNLPPGTMAVVKPVDASAVRVGDAITYQLRSGDPTVVTHRVVAVGFDGTGAARWQTQGDANNTADEAWVLPEQLKGRVWYAIPYLGHAGALFTGDQRGLLVGIVVLGLAIYAIAQLAGAWRARRTERQGSTTGESG